MKTVKNKPHYFIGGKKRKLTKEEQIRFVPDLIKLREGLKGWCFVTEYERIEVSNSEGTTRLLICSKDDNGNLGVCIGTEIEL